MSTGEFPNTDKLIVLSYPPLAGGKFLSNCLALSSRVLPMVPNPQQRDNYVRRIFARIGKDVAERQGDAGMAAVLEELCASPVQIVGKGKFQFDMRDFKHFVLRFLRRYPDVETRLDWVGATLPESSDGLGQWTPLEFSTRETYGFYLHNLHRFGTAVFDTDYFRELRASSMYHFSVNHREEKAQLVKQYFPNCRQIRMVNTGRWIDMCLAAGKRLGEKFRGEYRVGESALMAGGTNFDAESFFDAVRFVDEIQRLYDFFDLSDFNEDAVATFHHDYLRVHNLA